MSGLKSLNLGICCCEQSTNGWRLKAGYTKGFWWWLGMILPLLALTLLYSMIPMNHISFIVYEFEGRRG